MFGRTLAFAMLLVLGLSGVFSQDNAVPLNDTMQPRFIPEELLRPRRGEDPRYPIDTVIGEMGQGQASREAYEFARNIASALLAGTMDVPVLSTVNRVFLESCMSVLETVSPRSFRIGSGREEPDGAVSFLVRFVGREQGITGELFIRYGERRPNPPPPPDDEQLADDSAAGSGEQDAAAEQDPPQEVPPPASIPVQKTWIFEDLILEEPRSREAENQDGRHRFDFPPYERFF